MTTPDPIRVCLPYPQPVLLSQINLPYGLPPLGGGNDTCEEILDVVRQLNSALMAFYPFIKMAQCVIKVIGFLQLIPGVITNPSSVSKLSKALDDMRDCTTLMADFSGAGSLISYCRLIRDCFRLLRAILTCLREAIVMIVDTRVQADNMQTSSDPNIREVGLCLSAQVDDMTVAVNNKLATLSAFVQLVNALIEIVNSVAPTPLPISPLDLSTVSPTTTAPIDEFITQLDLFERLLTTICP